MSGKREQGKVRSAHISDRRDHGKSIKFRTPGTAREAGATRKGGSAGTAGAASSGIMPVLVGTLLQPILYFSKSQRNVIVRSDLSALGLYADHLLGWIPAYIVAGVLGFNQKALTGLWKIYEEDPTFGQQSFRMFTRRGNSRTLRSQYKEPHIHARNCFITHRNLSRLTRANG